MTDEKLRSRLLAASHGFLVVARDGPVGNVDRPLFPPDGDEPDYIVVRTGKLRPRHPIVAAPLVEDIDSTRRVVYLRLTRSQIDGLPENLPLAI